MKEVLQLLLTKHYFLNLKSKFPISHYTNVSMDPLGTACTSLGIHGSQYGNHQYMQILDHSREIRFKRFLCLRIEENCVRFFELKLNIDCLMVFPITLVCDIKLLDDLRLMIGKKWSWLSMLSWHLTGGTENITKAPVRISSFWHNLWSPEFPDMSCDCKSLAYSTWLLYLWEIFVSSLHCYLPESLDKCFYHAEYQVDIF